ncbi:MAG TPA: hypothetical protein V6D43_21975 [Candidatus Sericytochromatia bacterium]
MSTSKNAVPRHTSNSGNNALTLTPEPQLSSRKQCVWHSPI